MQLERRALQGEEVWDLLMVFRNVGSEHPCSFELFWRKRKVCLKALGPRNKRRTWSFQQGQQLAAGVDHERPSRRTLKEPAGVASGLQRCSFPKVWSLGRH